MAVDPGPEPRDVHDATPDELRARGSLKWTRDAGDVLGAWVAESDLGVAPPIAAALHRAVDRGLLGYLPRALVAELAAETAGWLARTHGWRLDVERIQVVPDVLSVLEHAIDRLTPAGTAVVLPTPAYMPFLTLPGRHGRDVLPVPATQDADGRSAMDLDGIAAALDGPGHLVVLCNPHNPVGRVYERDELAALAEVVEARGGRVFADEIHAPLVFAPHRHVPYASVSEVAARHSVTATSASKAWNLPGLKCAQVVFTRDGDLDDWHAGGSWLEQSTSTLGVVANLAAYAEGDAWRAEALEVLDGNRRRFSARLGERLPEVVHRMPEGTYLAWLDCRALDGDVAQRALDAGVAVTDGAACGAPGHVRVNLATAGGVLDEVVARLATLR